MGRIKQRTSERANQGKMEQLGGEIDGTRGGDPAASRTCMRARAESSMYHRLDAYVCVSSGTSRVAYMVVFRGFDF
jgi:hypothetical protein